MTYYFKMFCILPAITAPAITVPAVTSPAITSPAITSPAITAPAITAPAITSPAITSPAITAPATYYTARPQSSATARPNHSTFNVSIFTVATCLNSAFPIPCFLNSGDTYRSSRCNDLPSKVEYFLKNNAYPMSLVCFASPPPEIKTI